MANEMMRRNDMFADPFFDNLGRHFFDDFFAPRQVRGLKTDIEDRGNSYVARVDVPGINKDDIHLNYQDNVLSIQVTKHTDADHSDKDGNLLMQERSYGSMSRSYRLPYVDADQIKASYNDGVLSITLPKVKEEEQTGHEINID
ncbi:Hsp20/alpha crystallin family protein [Lacticaseibacillus thailandensis]|uniref:Heat shock protein Hsp20 n=1 Tax=Lacticaseibacillus thailandensis DSM 22698 = JCM 13996 TaxID=1423810 RepID=A0A0R2CE22_9LACO|nr:Hsp20/alpha crystallin family protein [Lacticaseibacillus thailandensis]KRM86348.1 heat shock protein Hsp20 [Lacticaseibacillus thailandensis DSM 22698 = JCM 13996]